MVSTPHSIKMQTPKKREVKNLIAPSAPKRSRIHGVYDLDKIHPLRLPNEVIEVSSDESDEELVQVDFPIRRGFYSISPADVAEERTMATLLKWRDLFSPNSQPRTPQEFAYVELMFNLIESRMSIIRFSSQ